MTDNDDDTKRRAFSPRPVSSSTPLLRDHQRSLGNSTSIYYTMTDHNMSKSRTFNNSSESVSSLSRSTRRPFHYPVNKQFIGQPVHEDDLGVSATYNR